MLAKEIIDLGYAISKAEGFGVDLNNVPTRAHNPGDLKLKGYPTTGDEGISVFPNDAAGWDHLYNQLNLIKEEKSQYYHVNMTFIQFARIWTDTSQNSWLDNVLKELRSLGHTVDGNTTLRNFFNLEV